MVGGFSGTVALPKNAPLIAMESTGGLSTSKESPDPFKKPNQSEEMTPANNGDNQPLKMELIYTNSN